MIRLEAAAATHEGQVRDLNEDSYLLGHSVFAVADGMGGHRAGEVASAEAVKSIEELDGRVFGEAEEAMASLRAAVAAANRVVTDQSRKDPSLAGMGTTLTVILGEGRRLHLAHIGDSRAYLLRGEHLRQLTSDHTFVQHLLDEGQITETEALNHPKRSIITRAIGVSDELELDVSTFYVQLGDIILLCSDGLTNVVADQSIRDVLLDTPSLQDAVDRLVTLANRAGGPDNITVVALRAVETGSPQPRPEGVPAAQPLREGDTAPMTLPGADADEAPEASDDDEPAARNWPIVLVAAFTILLLLGTSTRWALSRSYFVGVDRGQVAIFQGVPASIGPLDLHWVLERSDLAIEDVAEFRRPALRDGISAVSVEEGRRIIESSRQDESGPAPGEEPTPDDESPSGETGADGTTESVEPRSADASPTPVVTSPDRTSTTTGDGEAQTDSTGQDAESVPETERAEIRNGP